jgi:predicted RNA-binding protein YlxR (DUF448 family)
MGDIKRDRTASIRTCIGCRQACAAPELVRFVLIDGRPRADVARPRSGRGASLHPSEPCVRAALKTGAFSRAFRRNVPVIASSEILQQIEVASLFRASATANGNRNHS